MFCDANNFFLNLLIKLDPDRSLFDQGVKTDGTVQLSVQVISRQGKQLNVLFAVD